MEKIIQLDNQNYNAMNYIYYKGKIKKEVLKSKKSVLTKIPKKNILGLGYVVNLMKTYDGRSMDDVTYAEDICEYVIVSVDRIPEIDLKTSEMYSEKILLCVPLCSFIFEDEYKKESEKYKSKLNELGYMSYH